MSSTKIGGIVKTCGWVAMLFFSPAVSLTTLTFATVLAGSIRVRGAGLQEPNGDEFSPRFPVCIDTPDQPYSRRAS
jgi:hypothetical protein